MINSVSIKTAVTSIILVSVGIILFLIWLIYFREPLTVSNLPYLSYLPLANAIFNSLSAFCLMAGYLAIRKRKRELHLKFMLSALTFSFLFLVSYLIYHTFHGDTSVSYTHLTLPTSDLV